MAYTIGVDFGTDSVRCLIVDVQNGKEVSIAVSKYKRWSEGRFSDPLNDVYRQHPLDYIESLIDVTTNAVKDIPRNERKKILGIGVDTTGSTPIPVNKRGVPLSMTDKHFENRNAMFHLWKDHSAIKSSELINETIAKEGWDYLKYVGGEYSSEWFWAKVLHTSKLDPSVANDAASWIEHCDWIPFLLSGGDDILKIKRSRCACGHKALWSQEWGGVPEELLHRLGIKFDLSTFKDTYTSDKVAGFLRKEWAEKLGGLPEGIPISVGALDAHMGAVGGKIREGQLSKVIGTSTCDMWVSEKDGNELISGISGQVDGSILTGHIGYEAGQSAFGDIYAWFNKITGLPLETGLSKLEEKANSILDKDCKEVAVDWFNGRRTPYVNPYLKGAILNLSLSSKAESIYKSLVEATCFGSKKIFERIIESGLDIDSVVALGGISQKSQFVMQNLADILEVEIWVCDSKETCALGSAMYAAVASGFYTDIIEAMDNMSRPYGKKYVPNVKRKSYLIDKYGQYSRFGRILEELK